MIEILLGKSRWTSLIAWLVAGLVVAQEFTPDAVDSVLNGIVAIAMALGLRKAADQK